MKPVVNAPSVFAVRTGMIHFEATGVDSWKGEQGRAVI
jgi:hypothetical protein